MRFYLDGDLSPDVARIARAQGVDVISSHECGRNGLPDDGQLRLAAAEGRCLVTRNVKDFLPLTAEFVENGWPHAGVLIVASSLPNHDFAGIAVALVAYARRIDGDLPSYTTDFLSPAERSEARTPGWRVQHGTIERAAARAARRQARCLAATPSPAVP